MNYINQSLDINKDDCNIIIDKYIKFLKVRAHKFGHLYFYLPISEDINKRKVSDIIRLAYNFYNSKIDYEYLVTLQYDNIKKKANEIYLKNGYVLWKDLVGICKFKELITDCCRENAIELILDYNLKEDL